jgi:hypothetical protein
VVERLDLFERNKSGGAIEPVGRFTVEQPERAAGLTIWND